jgi:hypothetical protein
MNQTNYQIPQDLHIHTVFSKYDSAVVPEQTPELIARIRHAKVTGISDHFEHFIDRFDEYTSTLKQYGFHIGTEVDGSGYVQEASQYNFAYYIYHCRNHRTEYNGVEKLLLTGKPVIVAHPMALETDLHKLPPSCYVEINNRYIWKDDWRNKIGPFANKFRFVIGSDAHQPSWLNQHVARYVARELKIKEHILFD